MWECQTKYLYLFYIIKKIYLFYQPILEIHSTFQSLFAIQYIEKGNVNKYLAVPVKISLYGFDFKKKKLSKKLSKKLLLTGTTLLKIIFFLNS